MQGLLWAIQGGPFWSPVGLQIGSYRGSALVSRGLIAAGGVVDLHVRLQVVAVHVEA